MLYKRAGREDAERTVLSRDCPTPAMRAFSLNTFLYTLIPHTLPRRAHLARWSWKAEYLLLSF
jgi:hypothetical protein